MSKDSYKVIRLPKGTKYIRNADGTCSLIGDQNVEVTAELRFGDIYGDGHTVCRIDRFPGVLKDGSIFREVFLKDTEGPEDSVPDEVA